MILAPHLFMSLITSFGVAAQVNPSDSSPAGNTDPAATDGAMDSSKGSTHERRRPSSEEKTKKKMRAAKRAHGEDRERREMEKEAR